MVCKIITADKANRLYWLGRYVERVYISLHLLRRYYDKVLDGDSLALSEYYHCLSLSGAENDGFDLSQLYDRDNLYSIASSLSCANDNGIVLRQDITSESLSYLQMSASILGECSSRGEKNITLLQPVTDYMLAFFGSIDERVFDDRIRNILKIGKLIENLDLHIRFNYQYYRIEEVFMSLKQYCVRESAIIDSVSISRLEELINEDSYNNQQAGYKDNVLGYLNFLIKV